MPWSEIIILIAAGFLLGFMNTLAGGGSIVSLSVLMMLGLPAPLANGTNRITIAVQTLVSSASFRQQKVLPLRKALYLSVPAILGSLIGSWIAVDINEEIFEKAIGVIMLFMLVFIFRSHNGLHAPNVAPLTRIPARILSHARSTDPRRGKEA
jgi:uncharacterized membrane protein YfcA